MTNKLCPCGSGKKYEECCGKKKVKEFCKCGSGKSAKECCGGA